jgi:hypothetical protein
LIKTILILQIHFFLAFSIFSVVNFDNIQCRSQDTLSSGTTWAKKWTDHGSLFCVYLHLYTSLSPIHYSKCICMSTKILSAFQWPFTLSNLGFMNFIQIFYILYNICNQQNPTRIKVLPAHSSNDTQKIKFMKICMLIKVKSISIIKYTYL